MKNAVLVLGLSIGLISCNQSTKNSETENYQDKNTENIAMSEGVQQDGYTLMKENCYVCHNPNTKSHDDLLAPPFKGVKMHYMREYDTKEGFVNAVVEWVQHPSEDKALMKGAVDKFKVMPPLPLETSEIEKIANYIYENEVEQPEWMPEHMKEMQGKGMMKGMGKGNGNGKHKNKGMKNSNKLK